MDTPVLSPRRVLSLPPRALGRYLSAFLDLPVPELVACGALRAALRALSGSTQHPLEVVLTATDVETVLANRYLQRGEGVVEERVALLREVLSRQEAAVSSVEGCYRRGEGVPSLSVAVPVVLYLPHIRSPFNVGNIVRSAAAFAVCGVVVGSLCPPLSHPRALRAAMGGEKIVPVIRGGYREGRMLLAERVKNPDPVVVALETGGCPIDRFTFPACGILVVGHEQYGVPSPHLVTARRSGGIVSVPHQGVKRSLNVGVATGIALSWWQAP